MSLNVTVDLSRACVTSNGEWIYGFTHISDIIGPENVFRSVLLKAAAAIDTISDLSWSVVSTIDSLALASYESYTTSSCTVSPEGIFTLIGKDSLSPSSGGVRYDPTGTGDAASHQTGPGTWSNLTISTVYNWPTTKSQSDQIFYSSAMLGVSQVWHAYYETTTNTIGLGYVEESSKKVQPSGNWSVSVATQGQIMSLTYGNEQILAYVQNGQNSAILALPLSNYPSPAPSPSKTYPAPAAYGGCDEAVTVQSGYLGLSYYLACMNSPMESTPSQLFTIADVTAATTSTTANVTASVIDPVNYPRNNYFIPLGVDPNPFAWTGTQGLGLAGINRGHWEGPPIDPDITVPSEFNIGNGGRDSSSSSSSSSLSTGAIVGIVLGVLVVVGAVFWAMRKRNSDRGPGAENSSVPGKQEMGLGAMVETKPTVDIPPSPQMGTQVAHQGLGGFHQGQFSAHPRPNVATSMADTSQQL